MLLAPQGVGYHLSLRVPPPPMPGYLILTDLQAWAGNGEIGREPGHGFLRH